MGHKDGAGRSRQGWQGQESGGEPERIFQSHSRASAASRCSCRLMRQRSRSGERVRGLQRRDADWESLLLPTLCEAPVPGYFIIPYSSLPKLNFLPGSWIPLLFRTCGCSRRGSGVPQGWSIRVEHLEIRRKDARRIKLIDRHVYMKRGFCCVLICDSECLWSLGFVALGKSLSVCPCFFSCKMETSYSFLLPELL